MQTVAHYALLGSLIAGAAGALTLIAVTLKHGLRRRLPDDADDSDSSARTLRSVRLADTTAVLCFAVAAGLGVIGLMQQTRALASAARTGDDRVVEQLQALERRISRAESELQARATSAEPRAWDQRVAQLEQRVGTIENRAANPERAAREREGDRPRAALAATPPRVTVPPIPAKKTAKPTSSVTPSASPRAAASSHSEAVGELRAPAVSQPLATPAPSAAASVVSPSAAVPPANPAPPPVIVQVPSVPEAPPREIPPAGSQAPAREPGLAGKVASEWDALKRDVQRSGDEWREGWRRLRRAFGD